MSPTWKHFFTTAAATLLLLTTTGTAMAQKKGSTPPPVPAVQYAITWLDLPRSGDYHLQTVHGINTLGDVVGVHTGGYSGASVSYAWLSTIETGHVPFDLNEIVIAPNEGDILQITSCFAISDSRELVAFGDYNGRSLVPFRLALTVDELGFLVMDPERPGLPVKTTAELLPLPALSETSRPVDCNNVGDVLMRWGTAANSGTYASIFTAGGLEIVMPRACHSFPPKFSEMGKVSGSHMHTDGRTYAFQWSPDLDTGSIGTWKQFGGFVSPSSKDTRLAYSIGCNKSGSFVGGAQATATRLSRTGQTQAAATYHAFLNNGSSMTDLGVLPNFLNSEANAINLSNQVVGYCPTTGTARAPGFIWTAQNQMHNLDSLVMADPSWAGARRIVPTRICDESSPGEFGMIAGHATIDNFFGDGVGVNRAFLLTPRP